MFSHIKRVSGLHEDKTRVIKGMKVNYPYFNNEIDEYIEGFLNDVDSSKVDNIKYIVNYMDDYVNILFRMFKNSLIVDYHNILFEELKLISIENVLDYELLEAQIGLFIEGNRHVISQKEYEQAHKSYLFKDFELEIYLTGFNEQGNISLITINYHELKDHLLLPFRLSPGYDPVFREPTTTKVTSPPEPEIPPKLISFTFDDGPSPHTLEILDIMDEYRAKGTFFVIGYNVRRYNTILIETHARGHEIGNHTIDHSRLNRINRNSVPNKVIPLQEMVYNLTLEEMRLMRPPYGAYNDNVASIINMPIILWSIDTRDWEKRDVDHIVSIVMGNIKEGDIVLFHDLYPSTVQAVRVLLPILYEQNYQVVSVSELFAKKGIELENVKVYRRAG